jgi:hypothetical protein
LPSYLNGHICCSTICVIAPLHWNCKWYQDICNARGTWVTAPPTKMNVLVFGLVHHSTFCNGTCMSVMFLVLVWLAWLLHWMVQCSRWCLSTSFCEFLHFDYPWSLLSTFDLLLSLLPRWMCQTICTGYIPVLLPPEQTTDSHGIHFCFIFDYTMLQYHQQTLFCLWTTTS